MWLEQRSIGCEIGEVGRDQIMEDRGSQVKDFGFYSRCDGKPLKGFEQGVIFF